MPTDRTPEKCCAKTWPRGAFHYSPCATPAKVERDGKHYCRKHDPVAVKKRDEERNEKHREESAKRAEYHRRASKGYDELERQRDALMAALTEIAAFNDESANGVLAISGSYSAFDEPASVEIARKALALCRQGGEA